MAQQEKWEAAGEEEEALSLCDFPMSIAEKAGGGGGDGGEGCKPSLVAAEDFEFRVSGAAGLLDPAAEADMCAADEVFFRGQILPLRPSVSSDCGLFPASRGTSRCGSRSDSMDRYSSSGSRSNSSSSSSGGSSTCVSRSHSSGSTEPPRHSVSNNFYAHPSPTPQVRAAARRASSGRRSTGSAPPGWAVFRLGVVKAPEIELSDLRSRRPGGSGGCGSHRSKSSGETGHGKNVVASASDGNCDGKCAKGGCGERGREAKAGKRAPRFVGRGFGCKCSPEALDTASSQVPITRKLGKEEVSMGVGLKRRESMCRSRRIFEWLEEFSIAKGTGAYEEVGKGEKRGLF